MSNYNEQRSQNQSLHRKLLSSEGSLKAEKEKNDKLKDDNVDKDKTIAKLKTLCSDIYEAFRNVIQAVKLFKFGRDKNSKYKVDNLSDEQGRLIDSVVDYGAKWANEDGFPDIAAEIKNYVGISEGIQECIDKRTPTVQTKVRTPKM